MLIANEKTLATYLHDRKKIPPAEEMRHLLEVNGKCPVCGIVLIKKRNDGKFSKEHEIAHIFPNSPTATERSILSGVELLGSSSEDFLNKIALCKSCHRNYDLGKDKKSYESLLELKKNSYARFCQSEELADEKVEEEISAVINSLCILPKEQKDILPLNYDALKIREKIGNEDCLLRDMVESFVLKYYLFVQDELKRVYSEKAFDFNIIATRMRLSYFKAKQSGASKEDVFNSLVTWLRDKTPQSGQIACQIVVSYFIQNCEVFGEISQ